MTARNIPMRAADWSVWCWSKADNRWVEHPLDKMTVQIQDGVLSARNTTNSNWPRAILLYRGTLLDGDFIISADYRGQLESFDLQSADGTNQRLSCLNPTVTQSFNLVFQNTNPQMLGDATFQNVPVGIDPTTWPLDIDRERTEKAAKKTTISSCVTS